ncbi:MAG: glycosyltransferase [Bacteroidia bacterium]|nr:glycosyltransferase [Bacteroidia bacterium]
MMPSENTNKPGAPFLFLLGTLPAYFYACIRQLSVDSGREVVIVRNAPDPLSPFILQETDQIRLKDRASFSRSELTSWIKELGPAGVYVSGWKDRDYLHASRAIKRQGVPVIVGMDNQWYNTFRQRIACVISPFFLKTAFTHIWVPGRFQFEFARRLGFHHSRVLLGLYSADTEKFKEQSQPLFSKRFLYVGRMLTLKGTHLFIDAARQFYQDGIHDWEFVLIGSGPLTDTIPDQPNITYYPFLQQRELAEEAKKGGIFVLPSQRDAWGVVVHEFAAAGYPIVVSEAVGSRDALVKSGYNGTIVPANDPNKLYQALVTLSRMPIQELEQMGTRSSELARGYSPAIWSQTFLNAIDIYEP